MITTIQESEGSLHHVVDTYTFQSMLLAMEELLRTCEGEYPVTQWEEHNLPKHRALLENCKEQVLGVGFELRKEQQ
jgi:hypothetical protein